jgi:hypothetical protein
MFNFLIKPTLQYALSFFRHSDDQFKNWVRLAVPYFYMVQEQRVKNLRMKLSEIKNRIWDATNTLF